MLKGKYIFMELYSPVYRIDIQCIYIWIIVDNAIYIIYICSGYKHPTLIYEKTLPPPRVCT